ncbi:MAG: DUF4476 domain-containing protein [Crocinitomicaceae bacterium]|nr:DUF4476 domain-containing protein [Crocinitomicaceae bacterium]
MRILVLLLTVLTALQMQAQSCQGIAEALFIPKYNQVATQNSDNYKLNKAIVVFSGQCLKADQIKRVAMLFNQDDKKLEFCKIACQQLADYPNRYVIYDAFNSFSTVFQLHDYLTAIHGGNTAPPAPPAPPVVPTMTFPNYSYPSTTNYNGRKGCQQVTSDDVFNTFAYQVSQKTGVDQMTHIQNNAKFYCLSMAQLMKLVSLVSNPDNKLIIMKELFMGCFDLENYPSATAVFGSATRQTDWLEYCQKELAATALCQTTADDYNNIKNSIKQKTFSNDMLEQSRFFGKNKCLNPDQVVGIMGLFISDNDKVEVAKIFYDKCSDKGNYYKCIDALTFSMQKDELRNWLKNK